MEIKHPLLNDHEHKNPDRALYPRKRKKEKERNR
jgi:hypothetical protein